MIQDDVLVFDCVAHPFNFDPSNAFDRPGELFINHLHAFHQILTPENEPKLSAEEFLREWSTEESRAWSTRSPIPTCSSPCHCL
jgi:uncharacterized protein